MKKIIEQAYDIANSYWRYTEPEERIEVIARLGAAVKNNIEEIEEALAKEAKRPAVEIFGDEIGLFLGAIDYYIENAENLIKEKITLTTNQKLMLPGRELMVLREPKGSGIVNVISPWNNPFQIPLYDCVEVLVSGNIPILKPSEKTPLINSLIRKLVKEAKLENLFFIIEGGPETSKEVIRSLPKESHVTFTGSSAVGKVIKEMCAELNLYAHIEGGGADYLVVFLKPDSSARFIERAVNATVAARFRNRGQNCNAVKILLLVTEDEAQANQFARAVARRALELRRGTDMNEMFLPEQIKLAKEQLRDALQTGAECFTHNEEEALEAESYFPPVVLTNIKSEMRVAKEETFCPILPVRRVSNKNEALSLVNSSAFGLDAYIFAENENEGWEIAKRLNRVGSVCINDVQVNYAFPQLPFGGEDESGGSRKHGRDGILRYTRPKAIVIAKKMLREENHWFPYDGGANPLPFKKERLLRWVVKNLLGSKYKQNPREP
jgi:succinate-semialdehyde dehydrogenase/glutarate-semialdehyde dehydrogenase